MCTSASSPAGPYSGGTTAGSKQLPLQLQENTVTGKHLESYTHSAKIVHSKETATEFVIQKSEAADLASAVNQQAQRERGLTQGRAGSLRCGICKKQNQPFSIGDC